MTRFFRYLGRRRFVAVGLAIVVEALLLLPMAYADPSAVVGLPALVAAAIAGSVAVVFGPLDGALVALVGALLFGAIGGWGAGEVAALAAWPAIVAAAGLFARRVERQRHALAELMTMRENERQRLALELHDGTAQALTAALLALGQAEGVAEDDGGTATETTRALIRETIGSVRELAVELRPKALDDFGLAAAVERLAADVTRRSGTAVDVDVETGDDRLPPEVELVAFRAVQEVLDVVAVAEAAAGPVRVVITREPKAVRVVIERGEADETSTSRRAHWAALSGLRERIGLAGGRVSVASRSTGLSVRMMLPL